MAQLLLFIIMTSTSHSTAEGPLRLKHRTFVNDLTETLNEAESELGSSKERFLEKKKLF